MSRKKSLGCEGIKWGVENKRKVGISVKVEYKSLGCNQYQRGNIKVKLKRAQ